MLWDLWHLSTLAGVLVYTIYLCSHLRQPSLIKYPYAYFLGYACLVAFFQPAMTMKAVDLASQASAARFAFVLLLFAPCTLFHFDHIPRVRRFLLLCIFVDNVLVMLGHQGMFVGSTQSTMVAAIFLPLFWQDAWLKYLVPIMLVSIFKLHGVSSLVCLGVHLCFWLHKRGKEVSISFLPLGCLPVFVPLWFLSHGHLEPRLKQIWEPAFSWWWAHANPLIGTGPWSYEWLSGFFGQPRMWMHSDWLQILFEFGAIGLVASLLLTSAVLWRARGNLWKLSILVSLVVGMTVYSPMQFVWVWLLLCVL